MYVMVGTGRKTMSRHKELYTELTNTIKTLRTVDRIISAQSEAEAEYPYGDKLQDKILEFANDIYEFRSLIEIYLKSVDK